MRRRRLKSAIAVKTARGTTGNGHKLLRPVSVGGVLALLFAGQGMLGRPPVAQAGPVKPAVSSFTVTPSVLDSAGGSVTLSAQVTNATSCLFTVNKPGITGLPATVPCSTGAVTDTVSVPANSGKRTTKYRLRLSVTGAKTVHAKAISLLVSAGPVPPPPPPPEPVPADVMATPAYEALDVSWSSEPAGGGYEIDGYTATATGPNLEFPQTCTGATSCFVGGLTNGVEYSVTVQAYVVLYGDNGAPEGDEPVGGSSSPVMATPSGAVNCSYIGQYASLHGCDLIDADLSNDSLLGSDLSDADLTDANLTDADVNGVSFQGTNLTGAILTGADAGDADFQEATMTNTDMSGVDLDGADLSGDDLSGDELSDILSNNTNLSGADLSNADLTGANIVTTSLSGTILSGADFTGAALEGEDLSGDDLTDVNLTSAFLPDDTFTDANLTGANLTDARVNSDDLTGATLSGATLTGTTWNDTTCPDGTNSNAYNPQTCANDLS